MIYHYEDKVKSWAPYNEIEESAMLQIGETIKHPRLFKHVAIMPDVHTGIGCTIGSVIPIKDAIIPASVGVDIGCGVCAVKSDIQLDALKPHFEDIHHEIIRNIPLGFQHRTGRQMDAYHDYAKRVKVAEPIEIYQKLYPDKLIAPQLGTLGGGNHFIELQVDPEGFIWIMIHSGSRNIGNKIAVNAINAAITNWRAGTIEQDTPKDMEYLPVDSTEGQSYIIDMDFALNFALHNRFLMMNIIQSTLNSRVPCTFDEIINIHHNYAAKEEHFGEEVWIHRKGATKAVSTQLGIIPGSMGSASYIVRGKDNPQSFHSCSHGAGRTMSRTAARGKYHRKSKEFKTEGRLTVEDFKADMEGIFTKNVDRIHLDEAPRAYKDIDVVMSRQTDLVNIVVELKPVLNIKG